MDNQAGSRGSFVDRYITLLNVPASASAFLARSLGFTILGETACVGDRFFLKIHPLVTLRLRRWCVLGVLL